MKYILTYVLHFTKYLVVLEGYCDANWISDMKNFKSTSGYVFTIGGSVVSWKSTKQTCIAWSMIESEFIALDKAREEAEWLRNFLEDVPYWPKPVPAIVNRQLEGLEAAYILVSLEIFIVDTTLLSNWSQMAWSP